MNPSDTSRTTLGQWITVTVLSLSTFMVVTSEMLPIGVLTPMADGLGVTPGMAGLSLTITGLVAAVTAPIVPLLLGRTDRRTVLTVAMIILAAANASTALAGGFGALVASRIILGIGMGTVWGLAAAIASRLVAPRHAALAVSFAVSGIAAASVAGVPLATAISNAWGWRAAFATLAASAVVLAGGLAWTLPRLPRPRASATHGQAVGQPLLRTPAVVTGLAAVVFLVTAHFAAYTYVRPVLEQRAGLTAGAVALALLVYGIFGLAGNFAAGAAAARRARATVLSLAAGIAAAIVLLALFGDLLVAAGGAIALWGIAYGGLSVAGQHWMIQAAPHNTERVTGLYVGVFNASIALGAFLGGAIVETGGIAMLLWGAASLALLAVGVGAAGRGPGVPVDETAREELEVAR